MSTIPTAPFSSRSALHGPSGHGPQLFKSMVRSCHSTPPLPLMSPKQVSASPRAVNVLLIDAVSNEVRLKLSAKPMLSLTGGPGIGIGIPKFCYVDELPMPEPDMKNGS